MTDKKQMEQIYEEVSEAVDEILWNDWTPIGDIPRDEYSTYVPQIVKLKLSNATSVEIAASLFKIEVENMGLSGRKDVCLRVAEKIKALNTGE